MSKGQRSTCSGRGILWRLPAQLVVKNDNNRCCLHRPRIDLQLLFRWRPERLSYEMDFYDYNDNPATFNLACPQICATYSFTVLVAYVFRSRRTNAPGRRQACSGLDERYRTNRFNEILGCKRGKSPWKSFIKFSASFSDIYTMHLSYHAHRRVTGAFLIRSVFNKYIMFRKDDWGRLLPKIIITGTPICKNITVLFFWMRCVSE